MPAGTLRKTTPPSVPTGFLETTLPFRTSRKLVLGSYHTELGAYAGLRSGDVDLVDAAVHAE